MTLRNISLLFATTVFCSFLAVTSNSLAATNFKIDIDSTTQGGVLGIQTAPGWTSLNATQPSENKSVNIDGVTFSVTSTDGSRLRVSAGAPNPNRLTGDFVFDDGPGEAVILNFGVAGDLQQGVWDVDLYSNDAAAQPGNQFAAYRVNNTQTLVSNAVLPQASSPAVRFQFESDGTSKYDVFTRENSNDRSRLNAVELTLLSSRTPATDTVVRYNLDDGASDVSATAGTSQSDGVDVLAAGLSASDITSGLGWGKEVDGNNSNVGNGTGGQTWNTTDDNNTWWSRGSLLPTGSPNGTQFAEFTVDPEAGLQLDLRDGLLGVRMGATDRDQDGNFDFNVVLRSSADGFTSDLDLASLIVDDNDMDPYYVTSYFDVSSLGIFGGPRDFRLYFNVNFSGTPGNPGALHPILDTVFVLGAVVPEPSTLGLATLGLLSLSLVGWRRRVRG